MRTLAVAAAVLTLAGCTATTQPAETPSTAAAKCGETVRTTALPEWARAGFNWDGSGIKHVYGAKGEILAVLFGYPLSSPPGPDRGNKILWVARDQYEHGDLTITAELAGGTARAEQKVSGGPGPSIVDLPQPGCWHVTLTWPGHTDTMDLTYGVPTS
ncbi:hypothetical protein [Paractinoplanes lichenicola]|uniref:DUF4871 domain-containing protein n=1 Tax=Paractinoplanes lichenicola TaxID=2802976 RepID=A0ABS1VM67_9ACTN|nr:hypothetical protein [Actinoplanes lichenicola]MBL7255753.1 hypothetical protein [Actinoplanes lichenicola]